jgi:hypothetical protein
VLAYAAAPWILELSLGQIDLIKQATWLRPAVRESP